MPRCIENCDFYCFSIGTASGFGRILWGKQCERQVSDCRNTDMPKVGCHSHESFTVSAECLVNAVVSGFPNWSTSNILSTASYYSSSIFSRVPFLHYPTKMSRGEGKKKERANGRKITLRLYKSLYGLKQAGRNWQLLLGEKLKEINENRLKSGLNRILLHTDAAQAIGKIPVNVLYLALSNQLVRFFYWLQPRGVNFSNFENVLYLKNYRFFHLHIIRQHGKS